MEKIQPNEYGRMYAALVKSYAEGWSWDEATEYWGGYWPENYGKALPEGITEHDTCPNDLWEISKLRGNAEFWFSKNRNFLKHYLEDTFNVVSDSPIVRLFDYFLGKNRQFLFEYLAKKEWTGEEALYCLSCCPKEFVDSKAKEEKELPSDDLLGDCYTDYLKIKELLCKVIKDGVSKNYFAEFYGHKAKNKFNKSENGMNLPHPVACFKAFSRDKLEPQAFSPFIFRMADEIEAVADKRESKADELSKNDCEKQSDFENIEVVEGVTVKQLRKLLDEKNEGTTFCPRLLAAIRVELELNAMREQVKAPNTFTMVHGKSEKDCLRELIEQHCNELEIFNCNDSDAIKRSGRRTVTPQDSRPIARVLMREREAKIGRR